MSRETSQSIDEWAESVFGAASVDALAGRAQQELTELRAATDDGETSKSIAMEAADIAILLHRLTAILGFDLSDLIDQKMATNRARRWTLSGDGTGQHQD